MVLPAIVFPRLVRCDGVMSSRNLLNRIPLLMKIAPGILPLNLNRKLQQQGLVGKKNSFQCLNDILCVRVRSGLFSCFLESSLRVEEGKISVLLLSGCSKREREREQLI